MPGCPGSHGRSATSNGVQIAELASWDGAATAGVRNATDAGYSDDFPTGSGFTVFFGNHYFESVQIAAGTTTRVQPFGKADSVPAGVSPTDSRVVHPTDGWLGIYANTIELDGTIDAGGRGYGGAGGAGVDNTSKGGGLGGANGLSGNGAKPGGLGAGAAGGGGSGASGSGGGGGGGGGGILLAGSAISIATGARVDARGGADGGMGGFASGASTGGAGGNGGARTANGGTIKLFYDSLTGATPTLGGRTLDGGSGSFKP
jgi:hypothetical protein